MSHPLQIPQNVAEASRRCSLQSASTAVSGAGAPTGDSAINTHGQDARATTPALAGPVAPRLATTFLDGLRGLAALYVVIHHARYLLWEGYSDDFASSLPHYSLAGRALIAFFHAFRYGHEAVIFFFVLSGFVIHLRYARALKTQGPAARFDWWDYFTRRAKRLYPPLLFAMVLTLGIDALGMHRGFPIYFQQTHSDIINRTISPNHSLLTAAGNLLFTMGIYVPAWGTDGPLWSLAYEWWFYMAYPIFWWLTRQAPALAAAVMAAGFAVAALLSFVFGLSSFAFHLPVTIFQLMPIWWMGAILADIYAGRISLGFRHVAPLALVLPLGLIPTVENRANAYLGGHGDLLIQYLCGLAFSGVIACGFLWIKSGRKTKPLDALRWLGECSYTLYVIHMPLLVFLGGWLMLRSGTSAQPDHFGWICGAVPACVALAWVVHLITERPFTRKAARISA